MNVERPRYSPSVELAESVAPLPSSGTVSVYASSRSSSAFCASVAIGCAAAAPLSSVSVSFESDIQDRNELQQNTQTDDLRRNERRRNEAKAAIEVRLQCKR